MRGSPFPVDVVPAGVAGKRCEAFGDALHSARLRVPASFVVLTRDAHGNRRTDGGEHFIIGFRGPCNPIAKVHDRGDGTYRVTYVAAVSGTCSMTVMCGRQHVVGSPFRLVVEQPQAQPGQGSTPRGLQSQRKPSPR